MLLTATGIQRRYGVRDVLTDATLSLRQGERVGMVGNNGAGKSTLARILGGHEQADSGEIAWRGGARVAYLSQAPDLTPGTTALDTVLEGIGDWRAAMSAYEVCGTALQSTDANDDMEALLTEQASLAERIEQLGGWNREHDAAAFLAHVGILDTGAHVDAMSGGERRRVALARLLVSAPDLAILDEPTNHLDIATIEWLERHLISTFKGALLLVTHDRYLLDRVVTRTLEIIDGEARSYDGGWGAYLEAKALRAAHAERTDANRRNFLRRELEWLRRTPQARTTKQKARVDRAHEALDTPWTRNEKTAKVSLGHARSGRTILEALELEVAIGGRSLATNLTLRLSKGEIIGIVGPNGCGKTTLLRTLTGALPPASGTVTRGKNTRVAYLDQERGELDDEDSVFDNVAQGRAEIDRAGSPTDVNTYLERFLFTRHEQRKRVGDLSGGERARVALAKILIEDANVVILDEPTNDLDVSTLAALEEALLDFPGTVLVVTHDRWFLDRVATSLLVFEEGIFSQHQGGYADYVSRSAAAKRGQQRASSSSKSNAKTSVNQPSRAPRSALSKTERRELEGLLEQIMAAEEDVTRIEAGVSDASFYKHDRANQAETFSALDVARQLVASLTSRWEALEARASSDA